MSLIVTVLPIALLAANPATSAKTPTAGDSLQQALYGIPRDATVREMLEAPADFEGRAVRVRGRMARAPERGRFQLETEGGPLPLEPVPTVAARVRAQAPRWIGQDVELVGVFLRDRSVDDTADRAFLLRFWRYAAPTAPRGTRLGGAAGLAGAARLQRREVRRPDGEGGRPVPRQQPARRPAAGHAPRHPGLGVEGRLLRDLDHRPRCLGRRLRARPALARGPGELGGGGGPARDPQGHHLPERATRHADRAARRRRGAVGARPPGSRRHPARHRVHAAGERRGRGARRRAPRRPVQQEHGLGQLHRPRAPAVGGGGRGARGDPDRLRREQEGPRGRARAAAARRPGAGAGADGRHHRRQRARPRGHSRRFGWKRSASASKARAGG